MLSRQSNYALLWAGDRNSNYIGAAVTSKLVQCSKLPLALVLLILSLLLVSSVLPGAVAKCSVY